MTKAVSIVKAQTFDCLSPAIIETALSQLAGEQVSYTLSEYYFDLLKANREELLRLREKYSESTLRSITLYIVKPQRQPVIEWRDQDSLDKYLSKLYPNMKDSG